MPSIPLTKEEEQFILKTLGIQNTEDLFSAIPPKIRETADFTIDDGVQTEHELRTFFGALARKNAHFPEYTHFLGGGIYDNVIPAIVNQLVLRGEFLTCYTPYQPEISQGTLQAIFEFQTMISRITGMPVANASMWDGATATAEAVLMAQRLSKADRQGVLIASNLNPEYLQVTDTMLKGHSIVPTRIPTGSDGTLDLTKLTELLKTNPCAVVVGYPNYFGIVEPLDRIKALLPPGCLLVTSVSDLSSLSIFESPGTLGSDIVAGEAHQLGTPMLFGGPHVGFFATKKDYLRQMPGRLCGESVDAKGNRAYTLTLSTREQHIRREKATSNICTNQGLIALRTAIYLCFLGKRGFEQLGTINYSNFQYLTEKLESAGVSLRFKSALHYREGIFEVPNLEKRFQNAVTQRVVPGIKLGTKYSGFNNALLITVNPKHTKESLDKLAEVLSRD